MLNFWLGGSLIVVDEETAYEFWKPYLPLTDWTIGKHSALEGVQRFEVGLKGGKEGKPRGTILVTLVKGELDQRFRLFEVLLPG